MAAPTSSPVTVYWRPGCPFCVALGLGLRWRRVAYDARNIWADPDAAAFVASVTGGDETVPTVTVGERALVNPTTGQVVAAVREEAPGALARSSAGRWRPIRRPRRRGGAQT
ncbi:MAG TPA: glutaredoxin domain-containing protein [Acidimicrobiales bacterium]|nr:glutaredoxin domain-containing protein [Acidimicrobiales bacterium]